MFKKVLIVEDHQSANLSVQKTLEDLGIINREYVYYCDDALLRIEKTIHNDDPFDLLIADLYFEEDHRPQKISGGSELILAAKNIQPGLKILVFSAENKASVIEPLINDSGIDGYVQKARRDVEELKNALNAISKGNKYFKGEMRQAIRQKNMHNFSEYDTTIISLLSKGTAQKDIPHFLIKNKMKPFSLSSIE
ncbi:MAG: response regulator transcription factor, partial [Sphingobacteriales bacterium]